MVLPLPPSPQNNKKKKEEKKASDNDVRLRMRQTASPDAVMQSSGRQKGRRGDQADVEIGFDVCLSSLLPFLDRRAAIRLIRGRRFTPKRLSEETVERVAAIRCTSYRR